MKTFREIAEMHSAYEPSNEFDKKYRENRINALEKLLSEQLVCVGCGRTEQQHTGNGKDICPNYGGRFKAN